MAATTADEVAYLTALVRERDRPRYYAALFAPAAIRDHLFALYGFAAEIARVSDQVSEPALGEIRLRWWSDALAGFGGDQAGWGATPALRALSRTVAKHRLPKAPFEALVEARAADLYSDPPATIGDLEGRLGETESVLFQTAAIVAGAAGPDVADASGHAGVAYGIARGLATLANNRARGRTILPADVLEASGMSAADVFATESHAELPNAVALLSEAARSHLREARERGADLPRSVRAVFLPLAIVPPLLKRIEDAGRDIGQREVRVSDLESLLRIGLSRLR